MTSSRANLSWTAALLAGLSLLAACGGENSFETACRGAGHEPGSSAYDRCLDGAYATNESMISRYRSGGP